MILQAYVDSSYLVPAWIISDDKGLLHIAKVHRFHHLQDEAGREKKQKKKFTIKICIFKLFSHFPWIM